MGKLFLAVFNAVFTTTQTTIEHILLDEEHMAVGEGLKAGSSISPWLLSFNSLGVIALFILYRRAGPAA